LWPLQLRTGSANAADPTKLLAVGVANVIGFGYKAQR